MAEVRLNEELVAEFRHLLDEGWQFQLTRRLWGVVQVEAWQFSLTDDGSGRISSNGGVTTWPVGHGVQEFAAALATFAFDATMADQPIGSLS